MIDFSELPYAALSQNPEQHLPDLLQTDPAILNQADHDPDMLEDLWILGCGQSLEDLLRAGSLRGGQRGWGFGGLKAQDLDLASLSLVLAPLVLPAQFAPIILGAAPNRLPAPVLPAAAKETAKKLAPPGIAGMGEKKDATMPATAQASAQMRLRPQARSQEDVILRNQRRNWGLSIPVELKPEKLRDPDCKKPKPSLRMVTHLMASSSYPIATSGVEKVGRGSSSPFSEISLETRNQSLTCSTVQFT